MLAFALLAVLPFTCLVIVFLLEPIVILSPGSRHRRHAVRC